MGSAHVKIRRGRRTDYEAVMHLLTGSGICVPPCDRASLRRFRHIVQDLGGDLYVAEIQGEAVGVVHLTYSRQLDRGPRARIEQLVVDPSHRDQGVERALLDFAAARARKRDCSSLHCVPTTADSISRGTIDAAGLLATGQQYALELGAKP